MRFRSVIASAVLVVGLAAPAVAQGQTTFGGLIGVNFATLSGNGVEDLDGTRTGLAVGAYAHTPVMPKMGLLWEALFMQGGGTGSDVEGDFAAEISKIDFNVLAKLPFGAAAKGRAFAVVGPAFGWISSAKLTVDGEEFEDLKADDEIGSFDLSLVFGAGYDAGRWGVQGRYNLGVKDFAKGDDVKSRSFVILFNVGT